MTSNKFRQTLTISRVGKVSASLLFLLLLLFLSPSCNQHWLGDVATYATEDSSTASTNLNVNIQTAISVGLQQAVEMDITPKLDGTFAKNAARMQVATNSANGYILTLSTSSDTNDLINSNASLQDSIKPTASNTTEANFANNTWGYSLIKAGEMPTVYNPVPTKDEAASLTVTGDQVNPTHTTYDLVFATKVDINLPAGSYSNSVIASAVANPITISTLNQLTYMQDMTPEICSNTRGTDRSTTITPGHEVHRRLIDTRDGKSYWVAKLADNNCWMTQNLALDLKEGMTLTSGDTNLENGRVITVQNIPLTDYTNANQPNILPATLTSVPEKLDIAASSYYYSQFSWNFGNYVYATPLNTTSCGEQTGSNPLENCANFQNITSWQPNFQSTIGAWKGDMSGPTIDDEEMAGLIAADLETHTYDAHYLVGNYYQYNAALAGTRKNPNSTKSTSSICPKSWLLPSSGNIGSSLAPFYDEKYSFYDLLKAYGYENENYTWNNGKPNIKFTFNMPNISNGNYYGNPAASPFYFVRGGAINSYAGTYDAMGQNSHYWSNAFYEDNGAGYHFSMGIDSFMPAARNSGIYGFTIRCVAK